MVYGALCFRVNSILLQQSQPLFLFRTKPLVCAEILEGNRKGKMGFKKTWHNLYWAFMSHQYLQSHRDGKEAFMETNLVKTRHL